MADDKKAQDPATGTDKFPTFQDEAALKGDSKPQDGADAPVEFDHGKESPEAKRRREEAEKDPFNPVPDQFGEQKK